MQALLPLGILGLVAFLSRRRSANAQPTYSPSSAPPSSPSSPDVPVRSGGDVAALHQAVEQWRNIVRGAAAARLAAVGAQTTISADLPVRIPRSAEEAVRAYQLAGALGESVAAQSTGLTRYRPPSTNIRGRTFGELARELQVSNGSLLLDGNARRALGDVVIGNG